MSAPSATIRNADFISTLGKFWDKSHRLTATFRRSFVALVGCSKILTLSFMLNRTPVTVGRWLSGFFTHNFHHRASPFWQPLWQAVREVTERSTGLLFPPVFRRLAHGRHLFLVFDRLALRLKQPASASTILPPQYVVRDVEKPPSINFPTKFQINLIGLSLIFLDDGSSLGCQSGALFLRTSMQTVPGDAQTSRDFFCLRYPHRYTCSSMATGGSGSTITEKWLEPGSQWKQRIHPAVFLLRG